MLFIYTTFNVSRFLIYDKMASTIEVKDQFAFPPMQINTDEERRSMHQLNDGEEIQRPDIVDDLCQGLLLQARIDRIIHGYESEGSGPVTLVIFGFRFHGIDSERRFKQATITILFQDERKRNHYDPEVIRLWPNGDFTLGDETVIDVEQANEKEMSAEGAAGGAVAQASTHATLRWEQTKSFKTTDRSTLTGSIILDTQVRYVGPKNAIRLTISENRVAASGIVTDLRAAVLLKRRNDTDTFLATAKIKARANYSYNFFRGIRDVSGFSPPNDPIRFRPGVQYLRRPTLGDELEAKLSETVDTQNLNAARLDDLAGVLGTTVLATR
ncbi:hypothetical protein F4821DRAFT_225575 [Hypoxylon rubiginosum]|uniref:Uncharacterized protein n=1 Tax=Hypoxylon rubiginosum TaxID=110542 RepID=A0ACC0DFZ8_9PEZI|nr:hypothetical protein F4821DRAFT_225575 [Hypoxylon rubiginosum]